MDDGALAQHANPLKGHTRSMNLPLIAVTIWSRAWLGWWSLVPITAALIWTIGNARAFPAPRHTRHLVSRATFGERLLLNDAKVPIPDHHRRWAAGLSLASVTGLPALAWGLWSYSLWAVLLGLVLAMLQKLWFCDRMVWLYEDMKDKDPAYRAWSE